MKFHLNEQSTFEYSLPPKFSSLSTNSRDIPPPIINIAFVHRELTAMAQMIKIACNAGDPGSIPGLGKFPGQGNGYPLQYSCLENSMDRGAWWAQSMGSQRVRHN